MPDYKETSVNGTQWQRCRTVIIDNSYQRQPNIMFQEERLTNVNGELFQQGAGGLNVPFDPAQVITLLDPATGLPTGDTMTFGEMYIAMWSLYMSEAVARDEAAAT